MALMAAVIVYIDYKIVYPSQIAFHQDEAWKHNSPVRREIEDLNTRMKRIEELLEGIKDEWKTNTKY